MRKIRPSINKIHGPGPGMGSLARLASNGQLEAPQEGGSMKAESQLERERA